MENFESKIIKYAVGGALAEALYVWLVSWLLPQMEEFTQGEQSVLLPMAILMILVFSAGLSALLIFGYPVYLIIQKQYRLAVLSVMISLATLLIVALIIISLTIFK